MAIIAENEDFPESLAQALKALVLYLGEGFTGKIEVNLFQGGGSFSVTRSYKVKKFLEDSFE